jgi:hypothetical protein
MTGDLFLNGEHVASGVTVEFDQTVHDELVLPAFTISSAPIQAVEQAFRQVGESVGLFLADFQAAVLSMGTPDESPGLTWSELMAEIDRELEAGS